MTHADIIKRSTHYSPHAATGSPLFWSVFAQVPHASLAPLQISPPFNFSYIFHALYFHKAGYPPSLNIFSSVASSFFSSMNVIILSPLSFGCWKGKPRREKVRTEVGRRTRSRANFCINAGCPYGDPCKKGALSINVPISANSPRREPLTVSSRNGGAHLCDSAFPADLQSLWVDILTRVPLPPSEPKGGETIVYCTLPDF